MYDDNKVDNFAFNECNMIIGYNTKNSFAFGFGIFSLEEYFKVNNKSEYEIELYQKMGQEGTYKILNTDMVNFAIIAAYVKNERDLRFKSITRVYSSEELLKQLVNTGKLTVNQTIPGKFFLRKIGDKYEVGYISPAKKEIVLETGILLYRAVELLRDFIENISGFNKVFDKLVTKGLVTENERPSLMSIYMCGRCDDMILLPDEVKNKGPKLE